MNEETTAKIPVNTIKKTYQNSNSVSVSFVTRETVDPAGV
ncbi:hypothetical protein CU003_0679 [Enterococcus faecium]|nr:hypothetical protein [Enterococcus faecium]MBK4882477.1 hypothetical protein [Enterococcus faecium]